MSVLFVVLPTMCHLKRLLYFVLLFVAVSFRLQSQDFLAQRFEGKSDGLGLILYMEQYNTSVSGNLFVFHHADSTKITVSRMELIGTMADETTFVMKQAGFPEPCISGSFSKSGNSIALTGSCATFQAEVQVHKSVTGQMMLDLYRISETTPLWPDDPFSPKASLEMDAILPHVNSNARYTDALIRFASVQPGNDAPATAAYDSLMKFASMRFSDQYRRLAEGDPVQNQTRRIPDWERIQQMQLVLNDQGLVCIEKTVYAYSGGANGMTNSSYLIVNDSGNILTYRDIFREECYDELSSLIDQKLRDAYSLDAQSPLSQAGFFNEIIQPNDNLYLSHDGLAFVYNVYEIAPRSMGTIRVRLLPEEVEQCIEPGILNEQIRRIFHPAFIVEP